MQQEIESAKLTGVGDEVGGHAETEQVKALVLEPAKAAAAEGEQCQQLPRRRAVTAGGLP
ncbi:hypothetical protein OHS18_13220 [Amycolatopsis sp. NBC_00355]|uniref:hypothetical protein n=1 Tax=Amycolatopsis sp. NBC_00355 TaxID=2975957 RepID=UPI002E26974D